MTVEAAQILADAIRSLGSSIFWGLFALGLVVYMKN